MNHFGLSARRPGSLPLSARNVYVPFRLSSQQLFFVSRKFFAATVSRFSQGARSVYAPRCFRSQQLFFHFVKLSFHREAKSFSSIARSVYAPLRFRSQPFFFVSAKFHFACVSVNRFPSSRGAFMLLFVFEVNRFFHQRTNFLPVLSAFKN